MSSRRKCHKTSTAFSTTGCASARTDLRLVPALTSTKASGLLFTNRSRHMPSSIQKHRNVAFQRQSRRCHYCGAEMWLVDPSVFAKRYGISLGLARRFQCTAEHLIARRDGGSNSAENIVAACMYCNRGRHARKQDMDPNVYAAHVRRRISSGAWHPRHARQLLATCTWRCSCESCKSARAQQFAAGAMAGRLIPGETKCPG